MIAVRLALLREVMEETAELHRLAHCFQLQVVMVAQVALLKVIMHHMEATAALGLLAAEAAGAGTAVVTVAMVIIVAVVVAAQDSKALKAKAAMAVSMAVEAVLYPLRVQVVNMEAKVVQQDNKLLPLTVLTPLR